MFPRVHDHQKGSSGRPDEVIMQGIRQVSAAVIGKMMQFAHSGSPTWVSTSHAMFFEKQA